MYTTEQQIISYEAAQILTTAYSPLLRQLIGHFEHKLTLLFISQVAEASQL